MSGAKRPRKKRGTLHIIAALLVTSAVLRITTTGAAVAESATMVEPSPEELVAPASQPPIAAGDAEGLLRALQEREARLAAREAQFLDRMQALRLAESEVAEQLAALSAAEEALRATIALADTAAESDLERLTRVYENMKPKDAAELFEQMTPDFAAGFLGLMEPVAAAQIMTLIEPDIAYSISAVLAGRNAGVPTQ
ncbi:MotE family protein [Yoonia sp. R2331]|uniref:MotE family protein n=1 Tax=Yoonia sp. R2331 TaxID=3237238 RepID=UPI0034E5B62F